MGNRRYTTPGMAPVMGTTRLVGGSAYVNTAVCTPTSLIFVSYAGTPVNPGYITTTEVGSGTFRVVSTAPSDSSYVNWLLVQPF
jgi:hypothetical protein